MSSKFISPKDPKPEFKFLILDPANYSFSLLKEFYFGLLYPYFYLEADELDSFDDFQKSLKAPYKSLNTRILMIKDVTNDRLAAAAVLEHYTKSDFLLNSYIVVDDLYRGMKLSKMLVDKTLEMIKNSNTILVLETNDTTVTKSAMQPAARLKVHDRLGYELIEVDYIQAKLDEDSQEVPTLLLLVHKTRKHLLTKSKLKNFLEEFYELVDVSPDFRKQRYWKHMIESIDLRNGEGDTVKVMPYSEDTWHRCTDYTITQSKM